MSQYDVKPGSNYGPPLAVPPFEIQVEPESRLEGLLAQLEEAKAEADESAKRFKAIKDDIKSEVSGMAPGRERILLKCSYLSRPWVMRSQESWQIDSKMLKAVEPLTWVKYAKKVQAWYLEVAKS